MASQSTPQDDVDRLLKLFNEGRHGEAEALARQCTARHPQIGFFWKALGAVLLAMDRHGEALAALLTAHGLLKADVEVFLKLGNIYRHQRCLDKAETCYRLALQVRPDYIDALNNLGATLNDLGRWPEAERCYARALELQPEYADARSNLIALLIKQRRFPEAEHASRQALAHGPGLPQHYVDLALTLKGQARLPEAEQALRECLRLAPDYIDAHNNLGVVLKEQNRLREAESSLRRALEIAPAYALAHNNLGMVLVNQCRLDEAEACFRKALEVAPELATAHSNLLFALHYNPGGRQDAIFQAHLDWAAAMRRDLPPPAPLAPRPAAAGAGIRLGLISGNFRRHPVGYMILGSLPLLARQGFELVFFNETEHEDDFTRRFRDCAAAWHEIGGMSDAQVAGCVREQGVDILIDLVGHSRGARLGVAARRAAPLQVKWVGGLFNTTGLAEMDYLLSDPRETPAGAERWYTEKLLRLPNGYISYLPPDYAPEPGPAPLLRNGFITFGCFNNGAKINAELAALWGRILQAVPNSRLLLQYGQFSDPATRALFGARLEAAGVPPERVEMRGMSPHPELMRRYQEVDIALDTWPYSGGLTTCEALYMGVPVVSLPGPTFAGRHSCSHLHNVGLARWVAASPDAYVEKAVIAADRTEQLVKLRASLRGHMLASPLCRHDVFAGHLGAALRAIWARHCAGEAPAGIDLSGEDK